MLAAACGFRNAGSPDYGLPIQTNRRSRGHRPETNCSHPQLFSHRTARFTHESKILNDETVARFRKPLNRKHFSDRLTDRSPSTEAYRS